MYGRSQPLSSLRSSSGRWIDGEGVAVRLPLAKTVLVELRVLSRPTFVPLPVRIAADTLPLQSSSMKTAVGSSDSAPLVSVTCESLLRLMPPGPKPLSEPWIGASRWNAPKSRIAFDPSRMLIVTGVPSVDPLFALHFVNL